MPATPVTNRRPTPASGSLTMADYLKAQQPTVDKIRTGLALFAVFVIVRFLLQRVYALTRGRKGLSSQSVPQDASPAPAHLQQDPRRPAWQFNEKATTGSFFDKMKNTDAVARDGPDTAAKTKLTIEPNWSLKAEALPRQFISRLPPAPPLTPPELSSAVFNIAPGQPHAVDNFMRQPNPDYMSSTSSVVPQSDTDSPTTPRRRSYHRTLPIGIPTPQQSFFKADVESANTSFSPSSYPPASPLLPPPPPGAAETFGQGQATREMKMQGEIISVLDKEGAGWTRHTRVYGGGVCLACAASGGEEAGGFYGATVTPEEMRQDAFSRRSGGVFVQS